MNARFNLFASPVSTSFVKRLNTAGRVVSESALPASTYELIKIRASQINGCGYCTDMHTKDAAHAGETSVRLNLIAAWHEATVFSDAERAALALTEEATRIGDGRGVSDEVFQEVQKHYDEDQIAALIAGIAQINAWNLLNVISRTPAGDYQPGQWG